MKLDANDIRLIIEELKRELIPVLTEQLRGEITEQVTRQVTEMKRREQAPGLLKLPEVIARTGFKKSKIWALARAGEFPQPLKLGPKASAWREHEVSEWVRGRAA